MSLRGEGASCLAHVALVGHRLEFTVHEESGNLNLWFPDSCQYRRQQVGPGTVRLKRRPFRCSSLVFHALSRITGKEYVYIEAACFSFQCFLGVGEHFSTFLLNITGKKRA